MLYSVLGPPMLSFLKAIIAGLAIVSFGLVSNTQALTAVPQNVNSELERVSFDTPMAGPFAYTHFCLRYQDDCRVHNRQFRRPRPVFLTSERRRDLVEVNQQVNRSIQPKHYINDVSYDTWRIAPTAGDCNDYAITKRHELLARGWPSRALLLSEVVDILGRTPSGASRSNRISGFRSRQSEFKFQTLVEDPLQLGSRSIAF